jgi:hypothetical protein
MQREEPWTSSRRTFVRRGLGSTTVAGGLANPTAGTRNDDQRRRPGESEPESAPPTIERAVMFPAHVVSNRRATVVDSEQSWCPSGLESTHRTHVISYDHAPSLRAFLFAESETSLRPTRSVSIGTVREAVTVDVGSVDSVGTE